MLERKEGESGNMGDRTLEAAGYAYAPRVTEKQAARSRAKATHFLNMLLGEYDRRRLDIN